MLAAAPGPIRCIFVTHTHIDHSPGAAPLQGAHRRDRARPAAAHPRMAGRDLRARRARCTAASASRSATARTLRVIHTPGHASNHLCYLLEEEKTLFTGDHVMQRSTVVINPPDGDMAAYLASLRSLLARATSSGSRRATAS